ncbi:MAG: site-specific DNA-methyltransferase [Cyanobacteria bacterium]|nr:site-specific DNA-methyltransferase [Cyanobacteriota bacterium]
MQKLTAADPETHSPDLVAENLAALQALFPELITEGPDGVAVNIDVLKALVGDKTVSDADEKYGLNWHGKRRARQLALTPSTGTLRPCPEDSVDWDTTQNLMIEGDNLEVLKLLQKSYAGKVKLIYIDPPYNTGKDFVYPDNFQDNIKNYLVLTGQTGEGGKKLSSNTEASGRFHTDWLNMMYPRLKLARNLLRNDGVIFVTIDDHEVTGLKNLCDEIFGQENCQGILIWQHSLQPKGYSGTFSVHHNFILCYQKGEDFELINLSRTDENNKNYSNPDNDPNGAWRTGDVRNALYRPNLIYNVTTPSGKYIPAPANGWRWSKETMANKIYSGEIIFSADESRIIRKIYLNNLDGRTPETILFGKDVGTTRDAASELKDLFEGSVPFDTPKPSALIQHLVSLSGASGSDIILDFFAGSGSSIQAIYQHNVKDQKNLRVILVQLPEPVSTENTEQINAAKVCDGIGKPRTIAELTKERLRRSGLKIRSDNPLFAGDLGFRVFKLDSTNIVEWDPDNDKIAETLEASIEHLKTDRTEQDILFELLLKLGLDLCVPIETRKVEGSAKQFHDLHSIGGGSLLVCLSQSIPQADVEPLALALVAWHQELKPAGDTTVVFRDSAFADDVAKTNITAILQQHGLKTVKSL